MKNPTDEDGHFKSIGSKIELSASGVHKFNTMYFIFFTMITLANNFKFTIEMNIFEYGKNLF